MGEILSCHFFCNFFSGALFRSLFVLQRHSPSDTNDMFNNEEDAGNQLWIINHHTLIGYASHCQLPYLNLRNILFDNVPPVLIICYVLICCQWMCSYGVVILHCVFIYRRSSYRRCPVHADVLRVELRPKNAFIVYSRVRICRNQESAEYQAQLIWKSKLPSQLNPS